MGQDLKAQAPRKKKLDTALKLAQDMAAHIRELEFAENCEHCQRLIARAEVLGLNRKRKGK